MNQHDNSHEVEEQTISFFRRLETLGPLLQSISGDDLQVLLEFRRSQRRILFDLSTQPIRVLVGHTELDSRTAVAALPQDLQKLLLGQLKLIDGIDEKKVLLKGALSNLVRFFPIIELAPSLYTEHLHQQLNPPKTDHSPLSLPLLQGFFALSAYLLGCTLAYLPLKERQELLSAMNDGLQQLNPLDRPPPLSDEEKTPLQTQNHPLRSPSPSPWRALPLQLAEKGLRLAGRTAGWLKYRNLASVNLFDLLSSINRGLVHASSLPFSLSPSQTNSNKT